jgi:hypothetical protein
MPISPTVFSSTPRKPRFLALFGWAFQNLRADEFLICAEKPTYSGVPPNIGGSATTNPVEAATF